MKKKRFKTKHFKENVDPDIKVLHLSRTARKAAMQLKRKHSKIKFASGRRTVKQQAHAMAKNIIEKKDRKWIEHVPYTSKSAHKLQQWIDEHPERKTLEELAQGLEDEMGKMTEHERNTISKHLTGDAFDVKPQDEDAEEIKKDMDALPGRTKFLDKEGGLTRWHVQFLRGTSPGRWFNGRCLSLWASSGD